MTDALPRPGEVNTAFSKKGSDREPWELQDRLGRNKLIEWVLKHRSGQMANTTEDFQNYQAIQRGIRSLGFANGIEIQILKDKARTSGDIQGKNKLQGIQLLEEKPLLIPGGAGLYPPVEQAPGIFTRIKNAVGFGEKGGDK